MIFPAQIGRRPDGSVPFAELPLCLRDLAAVQPRGARAPAGPGPGAGLVPWRPAAGLRLHPPLHTGEEPMVVLRILVFFLSLFLLPQITVSWQIFSFWGHRGW